MATEESIGVTSFSIYISFMVMYVHYKYVIYLESKIVWRFAYSG